MNVKFRKLIAVLRLCKRISLFKLGVKQNVYNLVSNGSRKKGYTVSMYPLSSYL